MIRGQILGGKAFKAKLERLNLSVFAEMKKTMITTITEMDEEVKKLIDGGARSGKIYKRTKGGKTHQASAPGEAPKSDYGDLKAGFNFDTKATSRQIIGNLRNISKHAKPLEYKPKARGGRPFMRPLFKKWLPIARERFSSALKRAD